MQYAESLFFMPENAFIVQKTVLSHPEDIKAMHGFNGERLSGSCILPRPDR